MDVIPWAAPPLVFAGAVSIQSKHFHRVAAENFFFIRLAKILHLLDHVYGSRPSGNRVAVVEVTAYDDVVIGPAVNRIGEVRFPGDRRDIELIEIFAR